MCLSTKLHQKIFLNFKDKELSFSVKFQSSNFAEYALLVKFTFSLRIFLPHVITGVFSKTDFEIIVGYRFKRQLHKIAKNTQTIRRQKQTNCLSVPDHFVKMALKGLSCASKRC